MANYTKINLDLQSDLVLSNAKIDAVTGGLRSELDGILSSASAEETRALAAEGVLASDIAAEISRAEGVEGGLASDISAEETRAMAAEGVNATAIVTEKNRAETAEAGLSSDISGEKVRAMAAEGVNADAIVTEKNRAEAAEQALSNKIADVISNVDPSALDSLSEIVAAFQSADGNLSAAITSALGTHTSELATEIADRIAGDATTLAAAKVYTDALKNGKVSDNTAAIDAEVIRAKAAEVVNANSIVSGDAATLASGKTYADGKVATEKSERILDVNAEQTRAEGAESSLGMDIANETERAEAAELALNGKILAEKNRAEGIEGDLQTSIDNLVTDSQDYTDAAVLVEKGRAESAESGLTGKINAEEVRAMGAEAGLASDISAEEVRAVAAELVLTNNLATEVTRASAKEGVLSGEILTEKNRAIAAEGGLASDISVEKARAIAAEGVLDGKIGTEKGRIDAILNASSADKDSFAEIVTLINSVDTANDTAFGGYVTSNNAALATEKSDRIQGDSDLNDKIGVEASRAGAAELVLDGKINAEEVRATAAEGVNAAAIVTEKNRAIAAEAATLASAKTYAEAQDVIILQAANDYAAGLNVNYDGVGSADAAQSAAQSYADGIVADEKVRAKGIEGDLQTAIDNLVIDSQDYADAAVSGLRTDVDTAMEAMGAIDFSTIFAQKIGATTGDNQKYTLDKAVMGESLQVFENGLLLEEGADYAVNYGGGVNDAVDVIFGYQIKPDWKVKFFGVPFVASVSDLVA